MSFPVDNRYKEIDRIAFSLTRGRLWCLTPIPTGFAKRKEHWYIFHGLKYYYSNLLILTLYNIFLGSFIEQYDQ